MTTPEEELREKIARLERLPEVAGREWPDFGFGPVEDAMPVVFTDTYGLRWDVVWHGGMWKRTVSETPLSADELALLPTNQRARPEDGWLDELEAAAKKATRGPWERRGEWGVYGNLQRDSLGTADRVAMTDTGNSAAYIALAKPQTRTASMAKFGASSPARSAPPSPPLPFLRKVKMLAQTVNAETSSADAGPNPAPTFGIVSFKHTKAGDKFITFWRPGWCGYCWPLSWAGRYSEADARLIDYSPDSDSIAVPFAAIEALSVPTPPRMIDGDAGPVVLRTLRNIRALKRARIQAVAGSSAPAPDASQALGDDQNPSTTDAGQADGGAS